MNETRMSLDTRRLFLENLTRNPMLFFSRMPMDINRLIAPYLPTLSPRIDPIREYVIYNTEKNPFHAAIRAGDLAKVQASYQAYLYDKNPDKNLVGVPHFRLGNGTPLHVAAFYNQVDILIWLLSQGENPYAGNLNALHIAAYRGHLACVKALLDFDKKNKASPSFINTTVHAERGELNEQTALSLATVHDHAHVVKYLCEQGANFVIGGCGVYSGQPQSLGNPLVLCVENNRLHSFSVLLTHYINKGHLKIHINCNSKLLDRILVCNKIEIIIAYAESCPPHLLTETRVNNGLNILELILCNKECKAIHINTILSLIQDRTALSTFVTHEDKIARATPLHYLFGKHNDNPELITMANLLIAAGADLLARDQNGLMPIEYLPIGRREEVKNTLMEIKSAENVSTTAAAAAATVSSSALTSSSSSLASSSATTSVGSSRFAFLHHAMASIVRINNYVDGIPNNPSNPSTSDGNTKTSPSL